MKRTIAPHAHALEEKAARRTAILQGANRLFAAGKGNLPTAAQIAAATGLAKGTIYLYFRTKEEIFAALLLESWGVAMEEARMLFLGTKGGRAAKVDAFIEALVAHLDRSPELLRLDALAYAVLEKNMLHDALTAHKADYTRRLERTGSSIDTALRLPEGRGVQLLMRTYALTRGLWQSYQHEEETLLAGITVPQSLTSHSFGTELREALQEYWRGALTCAADRSIPRVRTSSSSGRPHKSLLQ